MNFADIMRKVASDAVAERKQRQKTALISVRKSESYRNVLLLIRTFAQRGRFWCVLRGPDLPNVDRDVLVLALREEGLAAERRLEGVEGVISVSWKGEE